jgi:hypothetical protein
MGVAKILEGGFEYICFDICATLLAHFCAFVPFT